MSEPSHRARLSKLRNRNRSESNLPHLGPELKQESSVCPSPTALAQFRIALILLSQHSPTPSLQSRPGFVKKVTGFFKRPEKVCAWLVLMKYNRLTSLASHYS